MGSVVGEKVARVIDRAFERRIPCIVFSSTGGARMQEGIFSLMQMAKTSAALNRFRAVRKPYVSVMLHPTTGGVAASFAWLGDVIIAEPKALIGFAGPRVIEQTIREKLPEGFQRSEFLLEHGMIDAIVPRPEMRDKLAQILGAPRLSPPRRCDLHAYLEALQPLAMRFGLERMERALDALGPPGARPRRCSTSPGPTARARPAPWPPRRCAPPATGSGSTPRPTSSRFNERIRWTAGPSPTAPSTRSVERGAARPARGTRRAPRRTGSPTSSSRRCVGLRPLRPGRPSRPR